MRKLAFASAAAALFVAFATPAEAQREVGVKLGINMATMSIEPDFGFDPGNRSAFSGGGYLRMPLSGSISLQPELMYMAKGFEADFSEGGFSGTVTLQLDYVEIPVLLRFDFPAGAASPYIIAGPAIAFEASCSIAFAAGGFSEDGDCDDGDVEGFDRKSLDVGIAGGAGVAIPVGPGNVLVEGRYTLGMMNISDEDQVDLKNRALSIFVGFAVALGMR